ncbi:hypothetical protein Tco_0544014, partial [Tanacetum coccineum]
YRTLAMIGALEKDKVQSGDVSAIDKFGFLGKRCNWMAPEVLSDEASNEKLSLWEGVTKAEKDAIGKTSTHTCRIVNLDDGHGYEQLNRDLLPASHKRNADSRGRRCLIESSVFSMAMQANWSDSTSAKQSLDMEKVRFLLDSNTNEFKGYMHQESHYHQRQHHLLEETKRP